MILQTHQDLHPAVNKYGCYFMSLLWHVVRMTRRDIDPAEIMHIYKQAVALDRMTGNCYVQDPGGLVSMMGMSVVYTDRHEPPYRVCEDDEVEVLCWERPRSGGGVWRHFVAGDGNGHVTYDPVGRARTVAEGQMVSKRIFRLRAHAALGEA